MIRISVRDGRDGNGSEGRCEAIFLFVFTVLYMCYVVICYLVVGYVLCEPQTNETTNEKVYRDHHYKRHGSITTFSIFVERLSRSSFLHPHLDLTESSAFIHPISIHIT